VIAAAAATQRMKVMKRLRRAQSARISRHKQGEKKRTQDGSMTSKDAAQTEPGTAMGWIRRKTTHKMKCAATLVKIDPAAVTQRSTKKIVPSKAVHIEQKRM